MSKASQIQTNFTSGELSPRLMARVDVTKYQNGAELLENFLIMPHGGITKRPAFRYIAPLKSTADTRLIPFKFSTVQAYIIEFGALYCRFYKDQGQILSGGVPYELVHTYTQGQIGAVRYVQSADTLFLTHSAVKPRKLTRSGHAAWTIADVTFTDGPYLDANASLTKTLAVSATTGSVTVTAAGHTPFAATDVGRHIRIGPAATWAWALITAYISSTQVTATMQTAAAGVVATAAWRLGAWSGTTGWPQTAMFHEERLWFGGTTTQPQTYWGSRSGDFTNFAPSSSAGVVAADNAVTYTTGSDDVNSIRWMVSSRVLASFTGSAEFSLTASAPYEAITPTNIKATRETTRGCLDVKPSVIDKSILFWQRAGRKLREYSYDFNVDGYKSIEVSILSEHITKGGITSSDYQQEPHSILWSTRADGQLIGFTYNKEHEVYGWHRHLIPGTQAKVERVACIPSAAADELWVITTRYINGATRQFMEMMDPEFDPTSATDKTNAFFVDCGLTYNGAPATVISGLDHLIGETVAILADGAVRPSQVVSGGGSITLTQSASVVHVGLGYSAKYRSVRWEIGQNDGTAQSKVGRVYKLGIRMLNTLGVKFGPSEDKLQEIQFRVGSAPMDSSPPLFTGDQVVTFNGNYDRARQVMIVADQPYPCTITGIVPSVVVND